MALGRLAGELVRFQHSTDPERFFLPSGAEESYRRWLAREIEDDDAIVLVAERDEEIVGYVYGRAERGASALLLTQHVALRELLVTQRARRQHVAESLVRQLVSTARARGIPRIVLHAATTNLRAQALFRKLGFATTMVEMTLSTREAARSRQIHRAPRSSVPLPGAGEAR
ncbi:MAG: GNAT family N-acetyltransferase [Sandaracinus sp.]